MQTYPPISLESAKLGGKNRKSDEKSENPCKRSVKPISSAAFSLS